MDRGILGLKDDAPVGLRLDDVLRALMFRRAGFVRVFGLRHLDGTGAKKESHEKSRETHNGVEKAGRAAQAVSSRPKSRLTCRSGTAKHGAEWPGHGGRAASSESIARYEHAF